MHSPVQELHGKGFRFWLRLAGLAAAAWALYDLIRECLFP